jgi:hypothetical protein
MHGSGISRRTFNFNALPCATMLAVEAATRVSASFSPAGVLLMARRGHGLQAELAPRCAKQEILAALDGEEHEAAGASEI